MNGRIHSYETFGAVDGPGIRFVVFFQGCPLRCLYCHNPDSWDRSAGTVASVEEIVEKVLGYKKFYRHGGGVTLSGGEPLMQCEFALELLLALKKEGIHTAIDTSGCIPLSVCKNAVDAADMILLDFKTFNQKSCTRLTGLDEILNREKMMLEYCEKTGKPVWIRHVIVPGLTLDDEMLAQLGQYLHGFSCVQKIEPLPFHTMGAHKWPPGRYTLEGVNPPTSGDMERVNHLLNLHTA